MNIFSHIKQKLYSGSKQKCFEDILEFYEKNGYGTINYVYFFSIYQRLIKNFDENYLKALENGDFLLPDGIALRLVMKRQTGVDYFNLNGTDFLPDFLEYLEKKNIKFQLAVWGAKPNVLKNAIQYMKKKNWNVVYAQDGYRELDRKSLLENFSTYINDINEDKNNGKNFSAKNIKILIQGRSTSKKALQEIWSLENKDFLKKNNILVFNQGGTLDFWGGDEKRAPKFFQKANLEWLWRVASKPQKNFQKASETFNMIKFLINVKK